MVSATVNTRLLLGLAKLSWTVCITSEMPLLLSPTSITAWLAVLPRTMYRGMSMRMVGDWLT